MGGVLVASTMKYHYSRSFFTYSVIRKARLVHRGVSRHSRVASWPAVARPSARRSALKTVSGGEFDWGGTSVKR